MPELTPSVDLFVLLFILALGLVFDFINGFHDTANAIGTVGATRVLSPGRAVLMASVLNFVGALSGTAVATTVGKGIIPPELSTQALVISALVAAIVWNLVTWYFGLPSSSSHALIFSLAGAGVASTGWSAFTPRGSLCLAALLSSWMRGLAAVALTVPPKLLGRRSRRS